MELLEQVPGPGWGSGRTAPVHGAILRQVATASPATSTGDEGEHQLSREVAAAEFAVALRWRERACVDQEQGPLPLSAPLSMP